MTQLAGCTVPLCFPSIVWDPHASKCVIRSTPTRSPSPSTRQSLLRPSCMHSFLNPESTTRAPTRACLCGLSACVHLEAVFMLLVYYTIFTAAQPFLPTDYETRPPELYSRTTLLMLLQPTMASAANMPMSFLHV